MRETKVLTDPDSSDWLRDALRTALACDPVRVANDALYLSQLLLERATRLADESANVPEHRAPTADATTKVKTPGR